MTRGGEKAKQRWWRPRFSVRTLTIVVTLICAYFAAWEATKRYGVTEDHYQFSNLDSWVGDEQSPMPFVISRCETPAMTVEQFMNPRFLTPSPRRRYYLWIFGPKIKLP